MGHLFFNAESASPNAIWDTTDPAGFTLLQKLPTFTGLSISNSTFAGTAAYADSSLQNFCDLSELKVLKLHENSISEFCRLVDLSNLPKLQHIRLSKYHITDLATEYEAETLALHKLLRKVNSQSGVTSLEIVGHPKSLFSVQDLPDLNIITQGTVTRNKY